MIRLTLQDLEATLDLGRRLGRLARAGDVLALDGELGAGKTQLVRGLAQGMGLDPRQVSSPTFVLMHEYEPPDDEAPAPPPVLVHIDAYRLSSGDELRELGYDEQLRSGSVTAIEWARRLGHEPDGLGHADAPTPGGSPQLAILLEHAADDSRQATLTPSPDWQRRLEAEGIA